MLRSHIADCGSPTGTDVWMCKILLFRSECGPSVADVSNQPTEAKNRSNPPLVGECNASIVELPPRKTRTAAPFARTGPIRPHPPARLCPGGKKISRWTQCSAPAGALATTKANCWCGMEERRGCVMRKLRTMA